MYKFDHRLYPPDHDLNKLEHTLSEDASIQAFHVNWFQKIVHSKKRTPLVTKKCFISSFVEKICFEKKSKITTNKK